MYKNNIITISGEPVSGKSSTVFKLIEKLNNNGINNIHLVQTGEQFRKYFGAVSEIVKRQGNIQVDDIIDNDDESMKKLFKSKELMNAIINAIINLKKKKVEIKNLSIEEANNLDELEEVRRLIDTHIDENIRKLGEKINSENNPNEIWIIDSRLAFHNIPDAFSIRLKIDEEEAAKRLLKDESRGKEDSGYKTIKEASEAIKARKIGEIKRYKQRYNVDLEDEDNYNLIIDTSYSTIDDIADTILSCYDNFKNGKEHGKTWTSPKKLLPLQTERTTLAKGTFLNIDEIIESIKNNGYDVSECINAAIVDNRIYIIDGHHRNFGAALAKKTLVPYEVLAVEDQKLGGGYPGTAREHASWLSYDELKGHEWMIGDNFSYDEVYPGIYDKLKEKEER